MERFRTGNWDDAVAEIETDTGSAGETGQGQFRILGRSVLALIRLHRNDLPGAREAAALGELSAAGAGYRADWFAWVQALLLEADGELADALATLSDDWDRNARTGRALEYPVIGPDLVRLALAAGEAGRARKVATAVTHMASRNQVPWITAAALRCQGLAGDDPGRSRPPARCPSRSQRPHRPSSQCGNAP